MGTTLVLTQTGFAILTLVCFSLLVTLLFNGVHKTDWEVKRKQKFKITLLSSLIIWAVFITYWSLSGILGDFTRFPFNLMPVLFIPLITVVSIMFSSSFTSVLNHVPPHHVIHLQSFRFFVELLLWALFVAGVLPIQMTFEGMNYDILAGITAPIVGWLVMQRRISKPLLIGWNIVCLGLLINIVTVAILSTPTPLRVFMNEPSNTIVTKFPVSLLPGFLVPLAYSLHFFSLRQLLSAGHGR